MLTVEEKISQSSYGTVSGRSHPNFAGVIHASMEKFVTLEARKSKHSIRYVIDNFQQNESAN